MDRKHIQKPMTALLTGLLIFICQPMHCQAESPDPSGMAISGDPRFRKQLADDKEAFPTTGTPFSKGDIPIASPSSKEPEKGRALMLAIGSKNTEEILSLIRSGADVNFQDPVTGLTPLMTADTRIQTAMLLAAGADPNLGDIEGKTALHHALFALEGKEIIEMLLSAGADVDVMSFGPEGVTPLLASRELFYEGRDPVAAERIIDLLVISGADFNAHDARGATLLMTAISRGRISLAKWLLNLGADPNLKTHDGVSALGLARRTGSDAMVTLIKNAGGRE